MCRIVHSNLPPFRDSVKHYLPYNPLGSTQRQSRPLGTFRLSLSDGILPDRHGLGGSFKSLYLSSFECQCKRTPFLELHSTISTTTLAFGYGYLSAARRASQPDSKK
jgi:hypothetical protein